MEYITHYYKRMKVRNLKITILAVFVSIFFLPSYVAFERTGNNMFTVLLNGTEVGVVASPEDAAQYVKEARRQIASGSDELVLAESDVETVGSEVLWGKVDEREQVISNMASEMASQTLSGWPSVTDSEVNNLFSIFPSPSVFSAALQV